MKRNPIRPPSPATAVASLIVALTMLIFSSALGQQLTPPAPQDPMEAGPAAGHTAQPAAQPVVAEAPASEAFPKIRVFPENDQGEPVVPQGSAFLVRVEDDTSIIASIRAKWDDQTIPCLPEPGRRFWYGLGGVERRVKPGAYQLDLKIETTHAQSITATRTITVKAVTFPTDQLTVAPEMATVPPDKKDWADQDNRAFRATWQEPAYPKFWDGPFIRPLPGRVTAGFGEHRVFNNVVQSVHGGVDLAGAEGTPVKSAAAGKVVMARECYIAGNTVIVDHGAGLFTYYCHLSEFKVAPGQFIEQGDVVGLVGLTGRITGPHLHWGCRVQGARINALSLLELADWIE